MLQVSAIRSKVGTRVGRLWGEPQASSSEVLAKAVNSCALLLGLPLAFTTRYDIRTLKIRRSTHRTHSVAPVVRFALDDAPELSAGSGSFASRLTPFKMFTVWAEVTT